jgi:hypothetical protein
MNVPILLLSTPGPTPLETFVGPRTSFFNACFVCQNCELFVKRVPAFLCPHHWAQRPRWQSYRLLMGWYATTLKSAPNNIQPEIMGLGYAERARMFPEEHIEKLRITKPMTPEYTRQVSAVFVVVDPNNLSSTANPQHSSFSFMAFACMGSHVAIVGAEDLRHYGDEDTVIATTLSILIEFIGKVRDNFPHSQIVFFCENNQGYTSGLLAQALVQTLRTGISVYKPNGQQPKTVPGTNYKTCLIINTLLSTKALWITDTFFSVRSDPASVRSLFIDQMNAANVYIGKHSGAQPTLDRPKAASREHNDLLMACVIGIRAIFESNTVTVFGCN